VVPDLRNTTVPKFDIDTIHEGNPHSELKNVMIST
jgi:hypothetical protein